MERYNKILADGVKAQKAVSVETMLAFTKEEKKEKKKGKTGMSSTPGDSHSDSYKFEGIAQLRAVAADLKKLANEVVTRPGAKAVEDTQKNVKIAERMPLLKTANAKNFIAKESLGALTMQERTSANGTTFKTGGDDASKNFEAIVSKQQEIIEAQINDSTDKKEKKALRQELSALETCPKARAEKLADAVIDAVGVNIASTLSIADRGKTSSAARGKPDAKRKQLAFEAKNALESEGDNSNQVLRKILVGQAKLYESYAKRKECELQYLKTKLGRSKKGALSNKISEVEKQ